MAVLPVDLADTHKIQLGWKYRCAGEGHAGLEDELVGFAADEGLQRVVHEGGHIVGAGLVLEAAGGWVDADVKGYDWGAGAAGADEGEITSSVWTLVFVIKT